VAARSQGPLAGSPAQKSSANEQSWKAGVLEERKGGQPTERGTPQGAVISPVLANLYLNPLDHEMARRGWALVR
jgi:RNA-directed DNA polymerase